jgi:RNA polymerase sigma-70 factor (ECF subfamily)
MCTTQATLLDRLRAGSAALAWEEFFERYGGAVYALARSRGCGGHSAEEVVQEVMLTVFAQRDVFQYDPQRGRFRDWLAAVVRNTVATRRRQPAERVRAAGGMADTGETPVPLVEPQASEPPPDAACETAFEQAMLAVLLAVVRHEFSPETYQAFELVTLHELPGRAAAEMTGLSRNAVYLARRRVFQRLRELGAPYRKDGQLAERVKQALASLPDEGAQSAMNARIEQTMRGAREPPG